MSSGKDGERLPLTTNQAASNSSDGCQGFDCCLRYINSISRLCGLAVLALMWTATVVSLRGETKAPEYVGYYLLAASILVSFFELSWLVDKLICCDRRGCCCNCWAVILWVDGYRKFILYTALTVPLFLQGTKGLIHVITGFCLLVLACLYLVKSFASLRGEPDRRQKITDIRLSSVSVVRHEATTQTDPMSSPDVPTVERSVPSNPFENDEVEEEEKDQNKSDQTEEKAKDETGKTS